MFKVSPTQEIFISRGDDSGTFNLEVNLGTSYEPLLYEFIHACSVYSKPDRLEVSLDKKKFKGQANAEKMYTFEYNYLYDEKGKRINKLGWYLEQEPVNLEDWGISYIGIPQVYDRIIISFYIKHISEVYLNVFGIHSYSECYYLQKIYRNDGKVVTNKNAGNDYSIVKSYDQVINNGNLLLRFEPEDTEFLEPGEYRYQIKIKVYDRENNKWIVNTLNHPTAFYVMN